MGGGLGLGGDTALVLLLLPAAVVVMGRCGSVRLCLCTGVKLTTPTFAPIVPSSRMEGEMDTDGGREIAGEGELEAVAETKTGPPLAGETDAVVLIVLFLGSTGVEAQMEGAGPSVEPELMGLTASGEGGLLDWINPLAALLSRARACEIESREGAPPKSSSRESDRQMGSKGEGGR